MLGSREARLPSSQLAVREETVCECRGPPNLVGLSVGLGLSLNGLDVINSMRQAGF